MTATVTAPRETLEPGSIFRPFPLEEYEARWTRVYQASRFHTAWVIRRHWVSSSPMSAFER